MVHEIFDPSTVDYDAFFQEGSGYYFEGFPYQRGYGYRYRGEGIGSIFRAFLRFMIPMVKSNAGKSIGKEALITSAKILDNIAQGAELKETIKNEAKEGIKRLRGRYEQSGAGPSRKRKLPSESKTRKKKKRRLTKQDFLGKKILKDIVFKNPSNKLGYY